MRNLLFVLILLSSAHNLVAQNEKRTIIRREGTAEFIEKKGAHTAKLIFTTKIFDPSKHKIIRTKNCITIDGRVPLGTDCGVPHVEIASIRFFYDGKEIVIPRSLYSDCYSPPLFEEYKDRRLMNEYLSIKFSDDMKGVFVFLSAGDGAGVYDIIWVLRKDGNHTRFTHSGGDCGFLNFNCSPNAN